MTNRTQLNRNAHRGESGQAFVEFSIVVMVMVIMLFGLIDFGRFIYQRQVLTNLSREGANLVLRNTPVTNAAAAVVTSANPLDLNGKGRLIISTVTNSNGIRRVTSQFSTGTYNTVSSKIGAVNGNATMPATATTIPAVGKNMYVTEVFYSFTPITPIGKLLKVLMPAYVYDAAYF